MPTKQRTYKIKSYVNASHAVRWATGSGKKHTHTWEIVCELHTVDAMVAFYDMANYKFNPNKPGIFQWQSVDDVFLMVVD
ncbi:hypothetical protein PGB25_00210 [Lactiplantibacillus plantarum]|nr:hypothetical protein [Lactiplantibacillus plantarum]WCE43531.1 hypothetical protein PGB25_00210 [Lactiplantibacillus plantarum]